MSDAQRHTIEKIKALLDTIASEIAEIRRSLRGETA